MPSFEKVNKQGKQVANGIQNAANPKKGATYWLYVLKNKKNHSGTICVKNRTYSKKPQKVHCFRYKQTSYNLKDGRNRYKYALTKINGKSKKSKKGRTTSKRKSRKSKKGRKRGKRYRKTQKSKSRVRSR